MHAEHRRGAQTSAGACTDRRTPHKAVGQAPSTAPHRVSKSPRMLIAASTCTINSAAPQSAATRNHESNSTTHLATVPVRHKPMRNHMARTTGTRRHGARTHHAWRRTEQNAECPHSSGCAVLLIANRFNAGSRQTLQDYCQRPLPCNRTHSMPLPDQQEIPSYERSCNVDMNYSRVQNRTGTCLRRGGVDSCKQRCNLAADFPPMLHVMQARCRHHHAMR